MNVMINGLPGNMASKMANLVLRTDGFELVPFSLTGPDIAQESVDIQGKKIALVKPDARGARIDEIKKSFTPFISVDYTHPSGVNGNAEFYCADGLPFVMGTTGGDRAALEKTVKESKISAVIAPNMAAPIVVFQDMIKYASHTFPNSFDGFSLSITESHQKAKADVSGTAKSLVPFFNRLGVPFDASQITMIRDPDKQRKLGVPEKDLNGHGWHTYALRSKDGSVMLEFTHNVNGRDVYTWGTMDAIRFLAKKMNERGNVYSMMDVLRG